MNLIFQSPTRHGRRRRTTFPGAKPLLQLTFMALTFDNFFLSLSYSDFGQRQADRERMERLLRPILSPAHRAKVWTRLNAQQESELA